MPARDFYVPLNTPPFEGNLIREERKIFSERLERGFFAALRRRNFCGPPGATVKNFDTTWQYSQDGQTAQAIANWQVGRPSKFLHSLAICPIWRDGKRKAATKVNAAVLKQKILSCEQKTLG